MSDKVRKKKVEPIERKKEEYPDQVEGRNAVIALLESGRDINKILSLIHI